MVIMYVKNALYEKSSSVLFFCVCVFQLEPLFPGIYLESDK